MTNQILDDDPTPFDRADFERSERARADTKMLREHKALLSNMGELRDRGAVIVLDNGDEIELSPEAIERFWSNYVERCQEAADEAYYGGDGPAGCYGPDDRRRP